MKILLERGQGGVVFYCPEDRHHSFFAEVEVSQPVQCKNLRKSSASRVASAVGFTYSRLVSVLLTPSITASAAAPFFPALPLSTLKETTF
jgi:hypothetical protein